jgi:acetyl-CoA carboxylase biotin carboxyl carrier protein
MADSKTPAPKLKNEAEIDTTLVRQLADILNDTSLTEIEVERGELRIRVARELVAAPVMQYAAAPAAVSSVTTLASQKTQVHDSTPPRSPRPT